MMNDMYEAGLLLNVDDYFAASEQEDRENFIESSFEYYVAADGNSYGIPLESTRGVFLANKESFRLQSAAMAEHLRSSSSVSSTISSKALRMS